MSILNLKVLPDLDCNIFVDNEFVTTAKKDRIVVIPLSEGEYWVQFVAQFNTKCRIEKIINIERDKVQKLNFLELLENHFEWHRDEDICFDEKQKCYISKLTGKGVFSSRYKAGFDFNNGIAIVVTHDNSWGCINRKGEIVIPSIYDSISPIIHDGITSMVQVKKHKMSGVLNLKGEVILPCIYDAICPSSNNFLRVKKDNKWGYIDFNGNIKIPLLYDKIISEEYVFNNPNRTIHPCHQRYDKIEYINWLSCVLRGETEYYVDQDGKEYNVAVPCIWDDVGCFTNGVACVKKDNLWGCIDIDGNVIVPCQYDKIMPFEDNGLAIVARGEGYGYINRSGKEIIPCKYRLVTPFGGEKTALVYDDGNPVFVDTTGNVFPYIEHFTQRKQNGLSGLVDIRNNELTPCVYNTIFPYMNRKYTIVVREKKYGMLNEQGVEFVPCTYDSISCFYYGVSRVLKDGKWGLVNRKGKEFVSCEYDRIGDFNNGLAIVERSGLFGIINLEGKLVKAITLPYYLQELYVTHRAKVSKKGKWGFIK